MKAIVDQDTCIGCGLCPSICPEVFEMNDDGKAETTKPEIAVADEASAQEARDGCPVDAIDLR